MKYKYLLPLFVAALGFPGAVGQVKLRYGLEMDGGWGAGQIVVTPYVKFSAENLKPYAGNRITKVRIGVNGEGTNTYLYIKNDPKDAVPLYRLKLDNLQKGWNEIELPDPFEISGNEPIAIGYKASFSDPGYVGTCHEKFPDATTVYLNSSNNWTTTGGNSLAIEAIVEGDNLPTDFLWLGPIESSVTAPYDIDMLTVPLQVRNKGIGEIRSFTLRCKVNGEESNREFNNTLGPNEVYDFEFEVGPYSPGVHSLSFEIESVNDSPTKYEATEKTEGTIKVMDPEFRRRVVMEEYSGLWCGLCPAAIVAIEREKEVCPEYFIPICVHGGDELSIELPENAPIDYSYNCFIADCTGAPWSLVDRKLKGNPADYTSQFNNLEAYSENNVNYDLKAYWDGDMSSTDRLRLVSTIYTSEDLEDVEFNLAYVVTEDNLTGYYQLNYYADNAGGPMGGWENKDKLTDDVVFNDIARGIFPNYNGEKVEEWTSTKSYERYVHTYEFRLPAELISKVNRDNINIVGLLINPRNGQILNAMKARPEDGSSALSPKADPSVDIRSVKGGLSISSYACENLTVKVYDLTGRKLVEKDDVNGNINLPVEGTVIVTVTENGRNLKTSKIFVR